MPSKIAISKFKSHCLEIIDKLQTNGQTIIITKRDKAIAQVLPIDTKKVSLFGMLKNKAEIKADIVKSIEEKWNAQHE